MMEWNTFVEYNKLMLMFAFGLGIGTFITSLFWLNLSKKKELK